MRRSLGIFGVLGLVCIAFLFGGSRDATSDPSDDAADTPATEPDWPYFQPTSTGHGEMPYEDLSAEEQEDVDAFQEQIEATRGNSADELAELSRQAAARARAQAAAMSVGLEGLDAEGVVP